MFGAACMQRRKKTGIYEFRRVVPERLRPVIGKREIVRSLGTRSSSDAKSLHSRVWQEVDELFQQAEERLSAAEQPLVWDDPDFTQEHAEALATQWLGEQLASDSDVRSTSPPLTDIQLTLQDLASPQDEEMVRRAIRKREYGLVHAFVLSLMEKHKLPFAYRGPSWLRLAAAVTRATLPLIRERRKRAEGDWPLTSSPPPAQSIYVAPTLPSDPHASFGAVFAEYLLERELPEKTRAAYETTIDLFHEITGTDNTTPIRSYTRSHLRDFKLTLLKMPSRRHGPRLRQLSVKQLVGRFGDDPEIPKISTRTVNKHIDFLRAIFGYAVQNDYLESNPASDMSIRNSKRVREKSRDIFTEAELKAIFTGPLFDQEWGGRQWLPVIALYMGCRLEEIGQAFVSDIRVQKDIHYLAIRGSSDGEQRVKTQSSLRDVPLHPVVIDLGFLDYVSAIKKSGSTRLFPDINSKQNHVTAAYSTFFGRYLDRLSIKDRKKTFHSFRHTFKDACREADIPDDVRRSITGHADGSVAASYGRGHSLKTKAKHLRNVRFGLEWERALVETEGNDG